MIKRKSIIYGGGTEELRMKNIRAHKLVREFNNSCIEISQKEKEIIKELFGSAGLSPSIDTISL